MSLQNLLITDLYEIVLASTNHVVNGHVLVGDFGGFRRGVTDWLINQAALNLFYTLFFICTVYTTLFTFWFDDEGVAFYECYQNFPSKVIFF